MSGNTLPTVPLVSVLEVRSGKRVEVHIIGPGEAVTRAVAAYLRAFPSEFYGTWEVVRAGNKRGAKSLVSRYLDPAPRRS
jgi:hypothetical protein